MQWKSLVEEAYKDNRNSERVALRQLPPLSYAAHTATSSAAQCSTVSRSLRVRPHLLNKTRHSSVLMTKASSLRVVLGGNIIMVRPNKVELIALFTIILSSGLSAQDVSGRAATANEFIEVLRV